MSSEDNAKQIKKTNQARAIGILALIFSMYGIATTAAGFGGSAFQPTFVDIDDNLATKASGTNPLGNQNVLMGQVYCTGITTGAITISQGTGAVNILGTYYLRDLNVSGEIYSIRLEVDNSQPTTSFGAGACGNSDFKDFALYAPATSLTNTWSVSFLATNGIAPVTTVYIALDVTSVTSSSQIRSMGGLSTVSVVQIQ